MNMNISENKLKAAGVKDTKAWVGVLNQYLPMFEINTDDRINMFLAQAAHESGGLSRLRENLNYSAEGLAKTWPKRYAENRKPNALALKISRNPQAIANNTYANRMGNGSVESGDGWLYRGRGIFQLTGKSNYDALFAEFANMKPDDLLEPVGAVISACWFWKRNNLNKFADKKDVVGCSKAINGGLIGIEHRKELYKNISECK